MLPVLGGDSPYSSGSSARVPTTAVVVAAARPEEAGVSATSFIAPIGISREARRVSLIADYMDARAFSLSRERVCRRPFAGSCEQRFGTSLSKGERTGRSQITRRGRHGWLVRLCRQERKVGDGIRSS